MVQILIGLLCVLVGSYAIFLLKDLFRHKQEWLNWKLIYPALIGLVTNFFDTLGIGSFALTTIIINWTGYLSDDRKLPGTLNVGHAIPIFVQAIIFLTVVEVDVLTLYSLIAASIVGALVGSKYVVKFSEKKVRYVVGIAMCLTGLIMTMMQLGFITLLGSGNTATGLSGGLLVIGIVGNFILGSLMSLGVGLYAPCMAMLYLLGLHPLSAFPIMMASCAGLMPGSGANFIKANLYDRSLAIGLCLGGIVGVFIAAGLVVNFPMDLLKWLIIIVVFYAGLTYIRKAQRTA